MSLHKIQTFPSIWPQQRVSCAWSQISLPAWTRVKNVGIFSHQVRLPSVWVPESRSVVGDYRYQCNTGTICAWPVSFSITWCFHVLWSLGPQANLQMSHQTPKSTDSFSHGVVSSKWQVGVLASRTSEHDSIWRWVSVNVVSSDNVILRRRNFTRKAHLTLMWDGLLYIRCFHWLMNKAF